PCPFCSQDLQNTPDLIAAYAGKFSEALNQLVTRLEHHASILNTANLDAALERIASTANANGNKVNTWSTYITGATQPNNNIIVDEQQLKAKFQNLKQDLQSKTGSPTTAISEANCIIFRSEVNLIASEILKYNQQVDDY